MTDTIEQAARAEAERRFPDTDEPTGRTVRLMLREGFEQGASWLAEYLLSDENVEKAARATFEMDGIDGDYTWADMAEEDPTRADIWRADARKVLSAVLGKEPSEHPCGDYPAPCNCDNPEVHDGH